jgi:hypothetical protein
VYTQESFLSLENDAHRRFMKVSYQIEAYEGYQNWLLGSISAFLQILEQQSQDMAPGYRDGILEVVFGRLRVLEGMVEE